MKKFFLFSWLLFFLKISITPTFANESPLEKLIYSGDFQPIQFLTFKKPFLGPEMTDDKSFFRYVSIDTPLNNRNYRPGNLVSIQGDFINQAGRSSRTRADVKPHLDALAAHFYKDFQEPIVIISGFRSAAYQQRIWDLGRCDDGAFCAPPGNSEHQLGITFDFFDAVNETQYNTVARYRNYVKWMRKNAHKYGFTESYQNGPLIDNYEKEPWHWRYIGVDMATQLHNLGFSYTQYIKIHKNFSQF